MGNNVAKQLAFAKRLLLGSLWIDVVRLDIFTSHCHHGGIEKSVHIKTRFMLCTSVRFDLGSRNTSNFLTLSNSAHLYGAALVCLLALFGDGCEHAFDGT